jgi:thermitase
MSLLLMLLALFPRPEITPVGEAEFAAARRIEAECAIAPAHRGQSQAWDSPVENRIPGRFVVGFEPGAADAAGTWVAQHGGSVLRTDEAGGFIVAGFPEGGGSHDEQLVASASLASCIRYFEPALRVFAAGIPNDPYFIPYQWDKWVMYADQAWDVVGGSMDVKVAVVDNGIYWKHPDLAASFRTGELGFDFIGNDTDPQPDDTTVSESFHGTHVAGIIAATRDNDEGIAGWSLAQLLAVRVLEDDGSGTTDVVASGIRWAADHGARIVNMSLTSASSTRSMEEACKYAAQAGVLLVAASGNEGQEVVGFPAALSQCIAVGASSADSRLAPFSNYGAEQEVVAPGASIISSVPGAAYGQSDGTSMAAPQVSGVAALVLARNSGLSASEVRAILSASAIDMGAAGRDIQYGYGFVNAKRAVDLAAVYATNREPLLAGGETDTGGVRTVIVRGGAGLPSWLATTDVFDGSGRLVRTGTSGLRLGTYFARVSPKPGVRSPSSGVVYRLLVLD